MMFYRFLRMLRILNPAAACPLVLTDEWALFVHSRGSLEFV